MLSLSKRADYALLALSHLAATQASEPARLVNTKEIAEQYEIPAELLAKLLQTLARTGIVVSHPGPTGGYRLLRAPSAISIAEIVTAIDGPLSILPCSNGQGITCKQFSRCTIRDPLAEIERRVKSLLMEITLADVGGISPAQEGRLQEDWSALPDFSTRSFAAGLPMG
ncbi:MAG: RrF2 family transcriptional regulator [Janthinobacterium lividum]